MLDRFRRAGFTVIKIPDADGERGSALVCRVHVGKRHDTQKVIHRFAR
jgi:hypothetical protein